MSCLVVLFCSRQSSYLWVQTVFLFSPACSLIHMRQTSYRVFLRTKAYDQRDDFRLPIVNFPFICSTISAVPAYGVNISQLIRYFKACGSYQDFLNGWLLLHCLLSVICSKPGNYYIKYRITY
jgi:hypothetical protein